MGKFKVGDRVRRIEASDWPEQYGELGHEYEVLAVSPGGSIVVIAGESGASARSFELVSAPLELETGKFYRTRDGRKVGPVRVDEHDDTYPFGARCEAEDCTLWYKAGGYYWNSELKSDHDLVAEWVDEPAKASNDNAAPKFKAGDRVHATFGLISGNGTVVTVDIADDNMPYLVEIDGFGDTLWCYSPDVTDPKPVEPTAIVALIENGQPRPSGKPYVHTTEESATKEAERLALLHPGQEFGVYVLAGSKIADEVITKTAVLRAA